MKPRLTRPEAGNKYYIRRPKGYSTAIKGFPADALCDVLANCVGYAFGRFHEIAGRPQMDLFDPVNAENIFANAKQHGLKTGSVPKPGALIVWQKGAAAGSADGAGHVAAVEEVHADGTILTSESGYGAGTPFWVTTRKPPYAYRSGYTLLGFVYQPETAPEKAVRKGDKGDGIIWMQARLAERGYLRKNEIDGDFGVITLGALLAFQFEHGLTVDGVCGPATRAALAVD